MVKNRHPQGRATQRNAPCLHVLEKDCEALKEARLVSTSNKIQRDSSEVPAVMSLKYHTSYLK